MKQNRFSDPLGLRLSRQALRVLKERGIFAHSPVSLEHQHLAKRYVIRGLESVGAVGDLGRYVTFAQDDGQPIGWRHPVEAIGVNGLQCTGANGRPSGVLLMAKSFSQSRGGRNG